MKYCHMEHENWCPILLVSSHHLDCSRIKLILVEIPKILGESWVFRLLP